MLTYFESLNGMNYDIYNERLNNFSGEIVLNEHYTETSYEDFFKAINVYSKLLLTKEGSYLMEVLGLSLKYYEAIGLTYKPIAGKLTKNTVKVLSKYRKV